MLRFLQIPKNCIKQCYITRFCYSQTQEQTKTQKPIQPQYKSQKKQEQDYQFKKSSQKQNFTQNSSEKTNGFVKSQLNEVQNFHQQSIKEAAKISKIPLDALVVSTLITSPILIGVGCLNYFCFKGLFLDTIPILAINVVKYMGIHQCFLSGIHWGYAISMHDAQMDSYFSTPNVRRHFSLATIPIFGVLYSLSTLCYNLDATIYSKITNIGILAGLQLFILGLDIKVVHQEEAPKWFLKLKYYIFAICIVSLIGLSNVYLNYDQLTKIKKDDTFRREIPDLCNILKADLEKDTTQKQQSPDLKLKQQKNQNQKQLAKK